MTPPPDGKPPVMPPISEASLTSVRFMMLGLSLVSIPLWYAPALVVWGRQRTAQSLFSSVVALWRTKGAFLTFLFGWFVVGIAYDAIVQMLAAVFGIETISLAAVTGQMVLSITYFISMWFGFVDTFEIASPVTLRTMTTDDGAATP